MRQGSTHLRDAAEPQNQTNLRYLSRTKGLGRFGFSGKRENQAGKA